MSSRIDLELGFTSIFCVYGLIRSTFSERMSSILCPIEGSNQQLFQMMNLHKQTM